MSDDYSREAFDAAFAEDAAAAAFGRGPRRVTEADQSIARAFGRPVPELTQPPRREESAEAALLREYPELRVSRLGESVDVARGAALVYERRLHANPVRRGDELAWLRERVATLRSQTPLSAGSVGAAAPTVEEFDSAFGGQRFAADGRRYTQAEVDESVARAFGRTTKGDQR